MKLLGVIIDSDLKWDKKKTKYLVEKANKKVRMLHLASKFTRNKQHLIQIYKTFIRCNFSYSTNVWHSSLTRENRQDLERVQKAALKVILKTDYVNYENALRVSWLQGLDEIRDMMSLKFAKNCLKNANFKKLFPENEIRHGMTKRNPLKYDIKKSNTERMRRSSIPFMQNQLNTDNRKRKHVFENLQKELVKPKHPEHQNSCQDDSLSLSSKTPTLDFLSGKITLH